MKINGKPYRTIWPHGETSVEVIDQTKLPHEFRTQMLRNVADAARAIKQMIVRGAPLIGATAAYGIALAMREDPSDEALDAAHDMLLETRPTAINLHWALKRMRDALSATGQQADVTPASPNLEDVFVAVTRSDRQRPERAA